LTSGTAYIQNRNVTGFVTSYNLLLNPNGGGVVVGTPTITSGGGPLQLGGGITFPATQVNSSNVNTLDDYNEGTCTLYISDGTNTTSGAILNYTKIGRLVNITGPIYNQNTTALSATNILSITNLPFATGQTVDTLIYTSSTNSAASVILGEAGVGSTGLLLYYGGNSIDGINFTKAVYGSPTLMTLRVNITYYAAT